MQPAEIFSGKPLESQKTPRQRISQDHRDGGAAGGGKVEGACFGLYSCIQTDITIPGKSGIGSSNYRYSFKAQPLEHLKQLKHLRGFTAVAEKQAKVSALYYPQIAVHCFDRVNENRWRASAGKGRRNLAGDNSRLPQPRCNKLPPHLVEA